LVRSVQKGLTSTDPKEREHAAEIDWQRLREILVAMQNADTTDQSSAQIDERGKDILRKMKQMVADLNKPGDWIEDHILVSGTYGYNFWRGEVEFMLRKGWIEVEGSRVRLTNAGIRAAG